LPLLQLGTADVRAQALQQGSKGLDLLRVEVAGGEIYGLSGTSGCASFADVGPTSQECQKLTFVRTEFKRSKLTIRCKVYAGCRLLRRATSFNQPMAQSSGRGSWIGNGIDNTSRTTDNQSSWYGES
jgi:hypothetical protein